MPYQTDVSTAITALQGSNTAVFNDGTISKILALTTTNTPNITFDQATPDANGNVTVAAGAEVVLVGSSNTSQTTVTPPVNAPVVIFQGKGGVNVTFSDPPVTLSSGTQTHTDRVVVGSAGNDKIVVADAKNTDIILGSGNSTVVTGHGVDTVEAGLGNSSIVGGNGDYAVVKLAGNAANYNVAVQNGHAVVTDMTSHTTTDLTKIQYVQLDNSKALVFAADTVEAAVADLYHATFGRDADAAGLNYWFDLAKAGASLSDIAKGFLSTSEAASITTESNTAFVQALYQNTFGRAGEDAGVAYWTDALAHGATRADLINDFSQLAAQNQASHASHTEATVVGNVTIVQGII